MKSEAQCSGGMAEKDIAELVYRSCMLLDEMKFDEYLALCVDGFRYRITAYSPEILKDMIWQEVTKEEMKKHLDLVPLHVGDPSPLARRPTVYLITMDTAAGTAEVVSGFQLYKTTLDGGSTSLLAIGKYRDVVSLQGEQPRFLSRTVQLETRDLGVGSQIPF